MAASLLSLSWLLPNHTRPWTAFHSDAWSAIMFGFIALTAFIRSSNELRLNGLMILVSLLIPIPILQYAFGLLPYSGQAWISTTYIIGFLLAIWAGQQWQCWRPNQLGDILFLAIGLAALISVGLQLQQWLGIAQDGSLDVWIASRVVGARPYANMGQANQLATLLLWGLLSCVWGLGRKKIGPAVAIMMASFLLVGLSLTQSRSASLGIATLVAASWLWRSLYHERKFPIYVSALGLLHWIMMVGVKNLNQLLLLEIPTALIDRTSGELRPRLWSMLWDAATHNLFFGYGWNQTFAAQLFVADRYPPIGYPFFQAHNLFLDLVLWVGVPLGLLLSMALLCWMWRALRKVGNLSHAVYFLMIAMIGIHAMLEYPLSYAYFLLPTGVAIGVLNSDLHIWGLAKISSGRARLLFFLTSLFGCIFFLLIAKDYFEAEAAYNSFQLEQAGIRKVGSTALPEVILLNQLREVQAFAILRPLEDVSFFQVEQAKRIVESAPSAKNFLLVAILLGVNQRPAEARQWLIKMCRIVPRSQCDSAPQRWRQAQLVYPQISRIDWPKEASLDYSAIKNEKSSRRE